MTATMVDGPNKLHRIDSCWMFISADEIGEGVLGAPLGPWPMVPLIACDEERLAQLRPIAAEIARRTKKSIKLIRLEARVELETIDP